MDNKAILTFRDLTKTESKNKTYFNKEELSKDLESISQGEKIKHIKFGIGTVSAIEADIIVVDFPMGEKIFPYPSAFFEGFLSKIDE